MQLTENFSLAEFEESDTALRLGINNQVPAALIEDVRKTAHLGEDIRAALAEGAGKEVPITVSSGYRCEALERVICHKDFIRWCNRRAMNSADEHSWQAYFKTKGHPKGRSMDFKAPRFGTPYQIVKYLMGRPEVMAHVDQLIMEGAWVHVGWSENPRHTVKTATFAADGTPSYSTGLV